MHVREPDANYNKQFYTIAAYIEIEEAAEEKHEYYQGDKLVGG